MRLSRRSSRVATERRFVRRAPSSSSRRLQRGRSRPRQKRARTPRAHGVKTCFVFAPATAGLAPYPDTPRRIVATSAACQEISGRLGLRYEEIPYDPDLSRKLRDTNRSKVPTVVFADADSLMDERYAAPLREYDDLYLRNCGVLVPWDAHAKANDADPRWGNLKQIVVPKTRTSALHDGARCFRRANSKARRGTVVEHLRLRLLIEILTDAPPARAPPPAAATDGPGGAVAQNDAVAAAATREGIDVRSTAQLEVPSK